MPEEPTSPSSPDRHSPLMLLALLPLVVAALIGLLVAVAGTATSGSLTARKAGHHMEPSHVTAPAHRGALEVLVGDYWFKTSTNRLQAGRYRFIARNEGTVQHDVMIERAPIKLSAPGAPIDEAAPFGIDGLKSGMRKSTTIMLSRGRWEIFCSVAGHYQAGQRQYLTVYGRMPRGMQIRKSTGMDGAAATDASDRMDAGS